MDPNDVEYDSDFDDGKRIIGMRRKAASDDEDGEEGAPRSNPGYPDYYEDLDGQGAASDGYEQDDVDAAEDVAVYDEDQYNDEQSFHLGADKGEINRVPDNVNVGIEENVVADGANRDLKAGEEEEKKNAPFSVPTAGAFYMHDDRLRNSGRVRQRRTYGGRRLFDLKEDSKWGHDKFEEINVRDRNPRGRYRGRYRARGGRSRISEYGRGRTSRYRSFSHSRNQNPTPRILTEKRHESHEPMRREDSKASTSSHKELMINSENPWDDPGRGKISEPSSESNVHTGKRSTLSYTSPPFYPSASLNKSMNLTQKRESTGPKNLSMMEIKNAMDSIDISKLYIQEPIAQPLTSASISNKMLPLSRSGTQGGLGCQASRDQICVSQAFHVSQDHLDSWISSHHEENMVQPKCQSIQHSGFQSQSFSPNNSAATNSHETEAEETRITSKESPTTLGGKEGSVQGNDSFVYDGVQFMGVTGDMGFGHGDGNGNFAAAPPFLPFMQFDGQQAGRMGVPAIGVAFPGYVTQPQGGMGSSEMSWIPVLTGGAGALGSMYCPPYVAANSAGDSGASRNASSVGFVSKENAITIPSSISESSQRPDSSQDEFSQRQKPRRYSEMDFKQQDPN